MKANGRPVDFREILANRTLLKKQVIPQELGFKGVNSRKSLAYLTNLRRGYVTIPFLKESVVKHSFRALKDFLSQPEHYQSQFSVKNEMEMGYSSLPGKKCYFIRHQQMPDELKGFISYVAKVHQIALDILGYIERDWSLKSASVLRLFSYETELWVFQATISRKSSCSPIFSDGFFCWCYMQPTHLTCSPKSCLGFCDEYVRFVIYS